MVERRRRSLVDFPSSLRGDIPRVTQMATEVGREIATGILADPCRLLDPECDTLSAIDVTLDWGPFSASRNSLGWSRHPYRMNCVRRLYASMWEALASGGLERKAVSSIYDLYFARAWWGVSYLLASEDSVPRPPDTRRKSLITLVECADAWEMLAVDDLVRVQSLEDDLRASVFWSNRIVGSNEPELRDGFEALASYLERSSVDERISKMEEAIVELCRTEPNRFKMSEATARRKARGTCRKLDANQLEAISGSSRGGAMALVPGLEFRYPID